ncbi:MAG: hypothetical protein ABJD68_02260, partial [Nakamurella sp.]
MATIAVMVTGQQALAVTVEPATAVGTPAAGSRLQVTGMVATPVAYSPADLAALPQTTVALTGRKGSVTGVSLQDLVQLSSPILGSSKNPQLRVAVTVTGAWGRTVTVALGELDPGFGNHPALLTI